VYSLILSATTLLHMYNPSLMQISNQPSNLMHVDMVKFKLRIRLGK